MSQIPKNATKVFQGEIFEVWQWQQKMFDGTFATFEALKRDDAVSVLATTKDRKIVVVEQLQPHWDKPIVSLPGGVCDSGGTPKEEGARELREETGYTSDTWLEWKAFSPPGKIVRTIRTLVARDCEKTDTQDLDAGEDITVRLVTLDELLEFALQPDFRHQEIQLDLVRAKYDPEIRKELERLIFG